MAEIGGRKDIELELNLLRHMVLNSIRSNKTKFTREFGELVIACDSKKYWRKDVFPYYKANRKKTRDDSGYDWKAIFEAINTIKQELIEFFPYKVIEVEGAEADDIIASLAKWSQTDIVSEGKIVPEPQPMLIISGDHDFIQLHKFKNVKQFSPVHKKFIKAETSPESYLIEHIIKGDKGDGVPNVFSSDDSIVNNIRQKPVSSSKLEGWINDPSTMPTDEMFRRNYDRNKMLVDLTQIPTELEQTIINTFTNYPVRDKNQLLNYFMEHRMKNLMELAEEF